jgi:diaminopimelate decarboxylase
MSMTAALTEPDLVLSDGELAALALQHGTPLYVYELGRLRAKVADLRSALTGAQARLFFATMANDRVPVLRLLADLGVGACVNSIPHLELARGCGFPADQIQFTSTGMTREDMTALQRLEIQSNLDSLAQLETWFGLGAPGAGIRINAASLGGGLNGDRIGIEAVALADAEAIAARHSRALTGLHIYLGTNFLHPEEMFPTLKRFFDLAASVRTLSYVNIGGGIGVDYKHDGPGFDVYAFGRGIAEYAKRLRGRLQKRVDLIVEPGRGLAAQCATFVTSVTDIKTLAGNRFAAVDASIAVFPRPFHHPNTPHRIRKLAIAKNGSHRTSRDVETMIVGRTTFSRDVLGSSWLPEDLSVGDLLALDDAGAYSQSMASRFLGQPEPQVAFVGR